MINCCEVQICEMIGSWESYEGETEFLFCQFISLVSQLEKNIFIKFLFKIL